MQQNIVSWFEIYVQDMDRAKAFYEAVFLKKMEEIVMEELVVENYEMWAFPYCENGSGAAGALVKMAGSKSGVGGTIVYFGCEDCAIEEKRVLENGGKVCQSKFSIGSNGFVAIATDTEGNVIGLHSLK